MSEQMNMQSGGDAAVDYAGPIAAARPISEFTMERVGGDVVLFDVAWLQYHTLNDMAYRVWRLCDGQSSVERIAAELEQSGSGAHVDAVELAVAQLDEAGLLQAPEQCGQMRTDIRVQRRKVLKLAAAGAIAAVAVPVVSSISSPDASAAGSKLICPDGRECPISKCCCCHPADQGGGYDNCDCSCPAGSGGGDCSTPGLAKVCVC